MYNSVFLIGFRTVGKSTTGKILAETLGFRFIDTDNLVEARARQTISRLTQNGTNWYNFRSLEYQVLQEVVLEERVVVSCGGGVGVNDIKLKGSLKTFGELEAKLLIDNTQIAKILLTLSESQLKQRLTTNQQKNQRLRPSLNRDLAKQIDFSQSQKQSQETLKQKVIADLQVFQQRKPLYEKFANLTVNTGLQSTKNVSKTIVNFLSKPF